MVWQQAGLEAIALAMLAEQIMLAGFYIAAHAWRKDRVFPGYFDAKLVRPLFAESRPAAYTRVDQILLRQLLGPEEVGLYAAAVNLSEALYSLPLLFAGAAFPIIVAVREARPSD